MIKPIRWLRTALFLGRCWWESHRHAPKLRKILADIEALTPESADSARPIYFFNASTRTWGLSQNAAYSLLASWGFRLRGIPVRHLVCMAGLQQCVLGTNRKRMGKSPPCGACTRLSGQMYPLDLIDEINPPQAGWNVYPSLNAYTTIESLRQLEFNGLNIGELCIPSLRWVLRRHNIPEIPEILELYKKYLRSAMHIAATFESLLDRQPIRALVVFNGITYPEAIVRQIALRRGICVVTHEVGVRPFSAFFTHGEATAYPIDIEDGFHLTREEQVRLEDSISKRLQGDFSMAGIQFWPEMRRLNKGLRARMMDFDQTVAVFTNVIFDTSQVHANVIFPEMFTWLRQVVEYANSHSETLFVIRAHPDEMRPGKEAQENVEQVLTQMKIENMENVIFIPPLEFVSSYDLIRESKFVMVYNSSIGLEATLLNRVVLCGGASRYSRYPTVYLPGTAQEYFRLADKFLAEDQPRPPQSFIEHAKRFYYVQHFLTSLDYSSFVRAHPTFPGYVRFKDFDPLALHPDQCRENQIVENGIYTKEQMFYDRGDVEARYPIERIPESA